MSGSFVCLIEVIELGLLVCSSLQNPSLASEPLSVDLAALLLMSASSICTGSKVRVCQGTAPGPNHAHEERVWHKGEALMKLE